MLQGTGLDDALDLLDILITEMFSDAERASNRARLRTLKDLDAAAVQLTHVCRLVLDLTVPEAELRSAIFALLKPDDLTAAVTQVDALVRPALQEERTLPGPNRIYIYFGYIALPVGLYFQGYGAVGEWHAAGLADYAQMTLTRYENMFMNRIHDLDWAHLIDRSVEQHQQ